MITGYRIAALVAFIGLIIASPMVYSATEEPIENIAIQEQGKQFPCWRGETTMQCVIRALHYELGDVQMMRL